MTTTFKLGELVCYRASFLRSISWFTNVPIDGKIVDVSDPEMPGIHWCDRDEPIRVNAKNLILKSELHLEPA